jgi:hypothetical protein
MVCMMAVVDVSGLATQPQLPSLESRPLGGFFVFIDLHLSTLRSLYFFGGPMRTQV